MLRFPVFVAMLYLRYFEHVFPIYYHGDVSSVCVPLAMMMTRMDEIKTMEKKDEDMKVKIGNKEEVVEDVKVSSSSNSFSCFLFLFLIFLHF